MTKIIREAMRENILSQSSSDFCQRLEALVNQTAMKAAPMESAMRRPRREPANIW